MNESAKTINADMVQDFLPAEHCCLDHLGVAVRSIAEAQKFYALLGLRLMHEELVESEQVRVAMMVIGGSRIELLEPTAEDSVVGKFLVKRGEGLHHIAVSVPDVEATFARLRDTVRLVRDEIGMGAGGHKYFFVHPSSTGGVLVEVVGR